MNAIDIRDKEATCGTCPWFCRNPPSDTSISQTIPTQSQNGKCLSRAVWVDKNEIQWCAQNPANLLALRKYLENGQPKLYQVSARCECATQPGMSDFYEDNIDYDEVETTQTPPQKYYTQGEINKLREQLAQRDNDLVGMEMKVQTLGVAGALSEKERTAAYMAGVAAGKESCAAGPWEPYQEEKHKDGEWRLIQFSDEQAVRARWVSACEGWCHKYSSLGDINPIRVAELKEPKT